MPETPTPLPVLWEDPTLDLSQGNEPPTDPASTPVDPAPQIAPEQQLFEVKINGTTMKVPLQELVSGYQTNKVSTQRFMEAADYRRQAEQQIAEFQERERQISAYLSDPRVQNALRQLQAGVTDPSQPLTAAQAEQMFQLRQAEMQKATETRMSQMAQELEVRTLAAQYETEIKSTLQQLYDKHPVLSDIEGIDTLLKRDVAARNPTSMEDAKRIFAEVAEMRANRIMTRFQEQQKQSAAKQAQLAKNGIEPPGGAAIPSPTAPNAKFGTTEFFQAALADYVKGSQG